MAREQFERDLVSTLAALEDARAEMLRAYDDVERLEVQLSRAGREVERMVEMTRRGGWDDDADFALMVLQDSGSTGREVAVALADTGIVREDLTERLGAANSHVVLARESLAVAEVRAPAAGPDAREQVGTVRTLLASTTRALEHARSQMHAVDVSVAAGQAFLSGPFVNPEAARSMATGADLHLETALVTSERVSAFVDESRDEITNAAHTVADQLQGLQSDQRSRADAARAERFTLLRGRARDDRPRQPPPARGGPHM